MERWLTRARGLCTQEEGFAVVEYGLLLFVELGAVVRPAVQLRGEPSASGKALREP